MLEFISINKRWEEGRGNEKNPKEMVRKNVEELYVQKKQWRRLILKWAECSKLTDDYDKRNGEEKSYIAYWYKIR